MTLLGRLGTGSFAVVVGICRLNYLVCLPISLESVYLGFPEEVAAENLRSLSTSTCTAKVDGSSGNGVVVDGHGMSPKLNNDKQARRVHPHVTK